MRSYTLALSVVLDPCISQRPPKKPNQQAVGWGVGEHLLYFKESAHVTAGDDKAKLCRVG